MQYTENYNLYKPVYGEPADVADLNHNADEIDGLIHDNRTMIAPAFDTAQAYVTDDPVEYQGKLYVFTADKAAGAWDSSKVRQTTAAEIGGGGGASALADLDDVEITSPTEGQALLFDDSNDTWKNQTIPKVEANPSASATDDLEKLKVGDTVYAISDPSVTAEATGNPITLTDAADAPLVECKVAFAPKQDLHGQDKPWAGGAGKNKLDIVPNYLDTISGVTLETTTDGEIWVHGTPTITSGYINFADVGTVLTTVVNETVTFSVNEKTIGVGFISGSINGALNLTLADTVRYKTGPYQSGGTFHISVNVRFDVGTIDKKYKLQIELGSTLTDWTPYSNICPITGMDEVNIERVSSVNLCPTNATISRYGIDPSGNVVEYATFGVWDADVIPGQYTISLKDSHTSSNKTLRIVYGDTEPYIVLQSIQYLYASNVFPVTFTVPPGVKHIRLSIREASASEIMLQRGSTSTPYVPYDSTNPPAQYTIQLGDTYYSGTVDAVMGNFNQTWGYIASYAGETLPGPWLSDRDEYAPGTTPTTGAEVAYELSSPVDVPIAPTVIRSLSGYNYIWTDADSMEIEYITKPYEPVIEATDISIEDHGKAIESIITENLEPHMVASRNYTIGELIISGDKAYRATANIASGATLTVGTNVESTTIEDEIGRSGHVYSTAEQVVGTWTDGSTLYEKSYHVSTVTSTYTTIDSNITCNNAKIRNSSMGTITVGGAYDNAQYVDGRISQYAFARIILNTGGLTVGMENPPSDPITDFDFTIQYTKSSS